MELEICAMVRNMFHGDKDSCAIYTSGGTESNELMVRAYKGWAR